VLVLAEQFPSNVYPWRDLAARAGGAVRTVARPADGDWTAAVLTALDERVQVAALPTCHWTDGGRIDLEAVGERCRALGAALVVDATQSLGAVPFDAGRVRPDVVCAAGYKWLLGPYTQAFAWFAPRLRDGRPLEHTWIGRAGSEDFARLVDYRDEYAGGARRFDAGERSNFVLLPMAIAALEQILAWTPERIAATVAPLTGLVERRAAEIGLQALPAAVRHPHMVGVRLGAAPAPDLVARLAAERVYVSVRGDSVRVSPHVYNTPDDVEALIGALARA
jgi:selenocysteine lyase/cysteine desulfurase